MCREIVAMHSQGDPVDMVTLGTRLGADYVHPIGQAAETTPNTKNAVYYAGIVRTMAERRRVIDDCKKQIAQALDINKPIGPVKEAKPTGGPVLTCLADVQPKDVSWLWPGRVPLGRITLLVGRPGEGKSFMTTDMAARVSTGTPWPDGSACPKGSVIFISAEDDPGDTIRPRLDAHLADVAGVHLLSAVRYLNSDGKPEERVFTLADLPALEQALDTVADCKLVVIDPIGSYLGGRTDAHRDNEVRAVLAPVAKLAERFGPAVVVVAHRRKSAGGTADDTALGSRAFTGIARAVWHLSSDRENKSRRLLLPGKNNLSAQGQGLAFSILPDPARIAWERDPVDISADDALAAENGNGEQTASALDEAIDWLKNALAGGPRPGKELKEQAKADGIAERTLERAKKKFGVVAEPNGFGGPWVWRWPEKVIVMQSPPVSDSLAKENSLADSGETGGLCDDSPTKPADGGEWGTI